MITGVVLAGGRSQRMGGGCKPLHHLNGKPLVAHVFDRLSHQCSPVLISANTNQEVFEEFGEVVEDKRPDFPGPLAGILAAMAWVKQNKPECQWLMSVAGDTPFIPLDLIHRLHQEAMGEKSLLAVAASQGRIHPVNALWSLSIFDKLAHMLFCEDQRRLGDIIVHFSAAKVEWDTHPIDPFYNINTMSDMEQAETFLKRANIPIRIENLH